MAGRLKKTELLALARIHNVEVDESANREVLEARLREANVPMVEPASEGDQDPGSTAPSERDAGSDEGDDAGASETVAPGGTDPAPPAPEVTTPTPAAPEKAPTPDVAPPTPEKAPAALTARRADPAPPAPEPTVDELDTEALVNAREIIDRVLAARGEETAAAPTGDADPVETAKAIPIRHEHNVSAARAARAVGVDQDRVLGVTVHQSVAADGEPTGDQWVVVVDVDGQKHAAKL